MKDQNINNRNNQNNDSDAEKAKKNLAKYTDAELLEMRLQLDKMTGRNSKGTLHGRAHTPDSYRRGEMAEIAINAIDQILAERHPN